MAKTSNENVRRKRQCKQTLTGSRLQIPNPLVRDPGTCRIGPKTFGAEKNLNFFCSSPSNPKISKMRNRFALNFIFNYFFAGLPFKCAPNYGLFFVYFCPFHNDKFYSWYILTRELLSSQDSNPGAEGLHVLIVWTDFIGASFPIDTFSSMPLTGCSSSISSTLYFWLFYRSNICVADSISFLIRCFSFASPSEL